MTHSRTPIALTLAACGSGAALLTGCERKGPTGGPARPDESAPAWFTDVTAEVGIAFAIDRSLAGDYFMPDSMGAGCALFDADGDGDLDLYLVNAFRDPDGGLATGSGANCLYRQEADGRFTDVTGASGAGHEGYGMGVAVGDVDNDGDADLFVTNYGGDCLLLNDGDGTFVDATGPAGIDGAGWSSGAAFFDYDRDGDLDLYVARYLDYDPDRRGSDAAGRAEYASPFMFDGVPDVLYRNEGEGTFTDVTAPAGLASARGKGLGVLAADLDDDGWPDVYVANDGEPNFAWMNDREGGFVDAALAMGVAVSGSGRPEASMGIAAGDADGDGDGDLFLTHLVQETNTFYRRRSPGRFDDTTSAAGLGAPSVDRTGFGTAFLDVELDGDLDLVVVNGRILRTRIHPETRLGPHWAPYAEPNQLFLNDGGGRFVEAPQRGGPLGGQVEVSRGLAVGDLDGDGDLDLVVANGNGTLNVYRNDAPRAGTWLIVDAIDPGLRRAALGAVVEVTAGGRRFRGEIGAGPSYLSHSDHRAHFGLGPCTAVDAIAVLWPDGRREVFAGGAVDRTVVVRKGEGDPGLSPNVPSSTSR